MKKKPKRKGAPSKYTPERIERICSIIRDGNFKCAAARAAGISTETLSQWEKNKPGFSEQIKKAEAEAEAEAVATIRRDASWQSKAWLLERRFPERWAKKEVLSTPFDGATFVQRSYVLKDDNTIEAKTEKIDIKNAE